VRDYYKDIANDFDDNLMRPIDETNENHDESLEELVTHTTEQD
jgi:hypothetical protein